MATFPPLLWEKTGELSEGGSEGGWEGGGGREGGQEGHEED